MQGNNEQVSFHNSNNCISKIDNKENVPQEECNPEISKKNKGDENNENKTSRNFSNHSANFAAAKEKILQDEELKCKIENENKDQINYETESHNNSKYRSNESIKKTDLNLEKDNDETTRKFILDNINKFKTIRNNNFFSTIDSNHYEISENFIKINCDNNHNEIINNRHNDIQKSITINQNNSYSPNIQNKISDDSQQNENMSNVNWSRNNEPISDDNLNENDLQLVKDSSHYDSNFYYEHNPNEQKANFKIKNNEIPRTDDFYSEYAEGDYENNNVCHLTKYKIGSMSENVNDSLKNKNNIIENENTTNNVFNYNEHHNENFINHQYVHTNKSQKRVAYLNEDEDGEEEEDDQNGLVASDRNDEYLIASDLEEEHPIQDRVYISNEKINENKYEINNDFRKIVIIKKQNIDAEDMLVLDLDYEDKFNDEKENVNNKEEYLESYRESEREDNSLLRTLEEKWESIERTRKQKLSYYDKKNKEYRCDYHPTNNACNVSEKTGKNNFILKNKNEKYENSNEQSNNLVAAFRDKKRKSFSSKNSEESRNDLISKDNYNYRQNELKMCMLDNSEIHNESPTNLNLFQNQQSKLKFSKEKDQTSKNKPIIEYNFRSIGVNNHKVNKSEEKIEFNLKETFKSLNNFKNSSFFDLIKLSRKSETNKMLQNNYNKNSNKNFREKNDNSKSEEKVDELELFIKDKTEILKKLKEKNIDRIKPNNEIENIEEEITKENEPLNTYPNKEKERDNNKKYKKRKEEMFSQLKSNTRLFIDRIYNKESLNNSDLNDNENDINKFNQNNNMNIFSTNSSMNNKLKEMQNKTNEIKTPLNVLIYEPNFSKNKTVKNLTEVSSQKSDSKQRPSFLKPLDYNFREKEKTEDKDQSIKLTLSSHLNRLNNNFSFNKYNPSNTEKINDISNNNKINDLNLNIIDYNNTNTNDSNADLKYVNNNYLSSVHGGAICKNKNAIEENKIYNYANKTRSTQNSGNPNIHINQMVIPNSFLNDVDQISNYNQDLKINNSNNQIYNEMQIEDESITLNRNNKKICNNNDFETINYTNLNFKKNNYSVNNQNIFKEDNRSINSVNQSNLDAKDTQNPNLKEKIRIIYSDICKLSSENEVKKQHSNLSIHKNIYTNFNDNTKDFIDKSSQQNKTNKNTYKLKNDNLYSGSLLKQNYPSYDMRSISFYNKNLVTKNPNNNDDNSNHTMTLYNIEKKFDAILSELSPKKRYKSNVTYKSDLYNYFSHMFNETINYGDNKLNIKDFNKLNTFNVLKKEDNSNSLMNNNNNFMSPISLENHIKSFNYNYKNQPDILDLKSTRASLFKEDHLAKNIEFSNSEKSLKIKNPKNIKNLRILGKINQNIDLIDSVFNGKRRNLTFSDNHKKSNYGNGIFYANEKINNYSTLIPTINKKFLMNSHKNDVYAPNKIFTDPNSNSKFSNNINNKKSLNFSFAKFGNNNKF